ncbi:flagellin modification protein A [Undibacterium sp. Jales W-56]|uniref:oxidoreductase n=1 Tax=Undibacterium sp. Jales W-56 TaxID=2897325 RepID=UPI0021D1585E|nr:oxidoreductase [Undibacterium sp. Jales W-56]MCU6433900.1 flagellin modification protein A [Undibacterium sp. Jales W-56]
MLLTDKVVVITGGAGQIGQELVKAVIAQGGIAIIADVNQEFGERTKEKLSQQLETTSIDFIQLDITSKDSIITMIEQLNRRYGRIDALVNNAYPRNRNYGRSFFDVEYADFCENLGLNLGGYFLMSQQLATYFKKQGEGNIINISSIYGVIAPRFEIYEGTSMTMPVEYAAIKSALIHLTSYMAKYFKGTNIRVNAISPGGVLAGQPESFLKAYQSHCMSKGMLDQSDISGALVFLLSEQSRFVNGQNIIVDDGFVL